MNYKRIMKSSIIASLIIGIGLLAGTPSIVKAQGNSEVNQQLAQVRSATAKYHDINVAIADGFVPMAMGLALNKENGTHGIGYLNVPRFLTGS